MLKLLLLSSEALINKVLKLDEQSMQNAAKLAGKTLVFSLPSWGKPIGIIFTKNGIKLKDNYNGAFDASICAPLAILMTQNNNFILKASNNPDLEISGDLDFIQNIQQLKQSFTPDLENLWARYLGDNLAHQLQRALNNIASLIKIRLAICQQNTSDYLQEEIRLLPTKIEIDNFLNDVDTLRADYDRLSVRTLRLERQLCQ